MNTDKLTPAAKDLMMRNMTDNEKCSNCKGKGTEYTQPFGFEQICFICHGTGKLTSLADQM